MKSSWRYQETKKSDFSPKRNKEQSTTLSLLSFTRTKDMETKATLPSTLQPAWTREFLAKLFKQTNKTGFLTHGG